MTTIQLFLILFVCVIITYVFIKNRKSNMIKKKKLSVHVNEYGEDKRIQEMLNISKEMQVSEDKKPERISKIYNELLRSTL